MNSVYSVTEATELGGGLLLSHPLLRSSNLAFFLADHAHTNLICIQNEWPIRLIRSIRVRCMFHVSLRAGLCEYSCQVGMSGLSDDQCLNTAQWTLLTKQCSLSLPEFVGMHNNVCTDKILHYIVIECHTLFQLVHLATVAVLSIRKLVQKALLF